jgi:hypothetical protein
MSQDKQHVRIEYRLRPEVDVDQQKVRERTVAPPEATQLSVVATTP